MAELLVNITGHLTLEPLLRRMRRKAYLDLDPGFTQFWHASGDAGPRLGGHDSYFTVGENIGSRIPPHTNQWHPLASDAAACGVGPLARHRDGVRDRFTTVATWRGPYGPVQYGGKTFGLKVHEFRKFIELPERVPQTFEIALDIHPAEEGI